jgi:hypothetical protein
MGWLKSHATHSWHMFYLSKNKVHQNQKTKNNVILSVGNVHRVQRCMHSLFSSSLMQTGEEFLQWHLKYTAQYYVSILLMCAGFCTCSTSKNPEDRNPVATDLGIEGATSFEKQCNHQRTCEWFLSCMLPVSRKRFTRWDTVNLFGTGELGNVSLSSFWQVK